MPTKHAMTPAQVDKAVELFTVHGLRMGVIATRYGVSAATLQRELNSRGHYGKKSAQERHAP